MFHSKVILKSMIGPDNTHQVDLRAWKGQESKMVKSPDVDEC